MKITTRAILTLLTLLLVSGCSHVISEEARQTVSRDLDYAGVRSNPQLYQGKTLLLGGSIVSLEILPEGSILEVYPWRLDRWGEPKMVDPTGRRFLVNTDLLLDPVVFTPGRLITLTGTMSGTRTKPALGVTNYLYPVFQLGEVYPWDTPLRYGIHPSPSPETPFYVEQGSRDRTNPYDPGYYNYPYTPYMLRPAR